MVSATVQCGALWYTIVRCVAWRHAPIWLPPPPSNPTWSRCCGKRYVRKGAQPDPPEPFPTGTQHSKFRQHSCNCFFFGSHPPALFANFFLYLLRGSFSLRFLPCLELFVEQLIQPAHNPGTHPPTKQQETFVRLADLQLAFPTCIPSCTLFSSGFVGSRIHTNKVCMF